MDLAAARMLSVKDVVSTTVMTLMNVVCREFG
jgi:hypothetical protein